MIDAFRSVGIEHTFIIRIGNHRDYPLLYQEIIQAQTEYYKTMPDVTLIATAFDRMAADGLMKDSFHYTQEGYNICGKQAGKNLAFWAINKTEPSMFDWSNQSYYFPKK